MKGLLALDIDGTLVEFQQAMPVEVSNFLQESLNDGWGIVFLTGRSHSHAMQVLGDLPFDFLLSPQNGSVIMECPSKRILKKTYLDRDVLAPMAKICAEEGTSFAVYSGPESGDWVYYLEERHSSEEQGYLKSRTLLSKETWVSLDSFEELSFDSFPSVKCIGKGEPIGRIAARMEAELGLHVPVIRDPYGEGYFVAQGSHPKVSKGKACYDVRELLGCNGAPVIAAGDDVNDIPLLKAADRRIAMESAPESLKKEAHIIAKPASQCGIIDALRQAMEDCQS